jgi:hypothetical protein
MKRASWWPAGGARLSLAQHLALLMATLLPVGAVLAWLLDAALVRSHALEQARAIALMTDAIGTWSSRYRGVWVLSDPTDSGIAVGDALDHRQARTIDVDTQATSLGSTSADLTAAVGIARTAATFHRKVPSVVQRELSEVLARGWPGARVHVAHNRPLDPRNAPDDFEQTAIAHLLGANGTRGARGSHAHADEYHETANGRLHYSRRLSVDADCMRCHAATSAAPPAMRTRYGLSAAWFDGPDEAYGGIVSVSVSLADMRAGIGLVTWTFVGGWMLGAVLLLRWVRRQVMRLSAAA